MIKNLIPFIYSLLIGLNVQSQEYRHLSATPFQIKLPSGFCQGYNSFYCMKDVYNEIDSEKDDINDYSSALIDSAKFRELSYSRDKILKFEKMKVDASEGIYIETKSKFGTYNFHQYIIYDNKIYSLNAKAVSKEYVEILRNTVLTSRFLPEVKPNALKDAQFTYDISLLKNLIDKSEEDYPNMKFKDEKGLTNLTIILIYKQLSEGDKNYLLKDISNTSIKESLQSSTNDIELFGIQGKEIYHSGLYYSDMKVLEYYVLLFDPNGKFYFEIKFRSVGEIETNLSMIKNFIKTLKLKKSKLDATNLNGNWKITKIEEAGDSEKCANNMIGKTIQFTSSEITYNLCEDDKLVEKKLKYEIKDGVLKTFDRAEFAGEMSDIEYTNKGYVEEDKIATIFFWKIGLVTMEKIK